jgi:NADH:ubiquinone oxidoreductase subunit 4 (subunit M)
VEVVTLVPLAALTLVFGIFPGLLLDLVDGSVAGVLAQVAGDALATIAR